jgi:hypothetical protein
MLHPELKGQISQIIWCAGRRPFLHFNPGRGKINVCDCNFDQATEAGQILLSSGVKILLSGYEPASSIYISLSDISGLKKSENPVCRWLYYRLKNWSKIWSFFLGSKKGFIPFDAVTLGSFLYPELTLVRAGLPAVIEENKSDMPSFFKSKKSYLLVSPMLDSVYKVDYCRTMDSGFKEIMLNLILESPAQGIATIDSMHF